MGNALKITRVVLVLLAPHSLLRSQFSVDGQPQVTPDPNPILAGWPSPAGSGTRGFSLLTFH